MNSQELIGDSTYLKYKVLQVKANELDKAKRFSEEAMKNCVKLGSRPKFQTHELTNKMMGYLGELKFYQFMNQKGKWDPQPDGKTDGGVDWTSPMGHKVDVKTRKWNCPPRTFHPMPVVKENFIGHPPQYYVFCSVPDEMNYVRILGYISYQDFKDNAVFLKRGEKMLYCVNKNDSYHVKGHHLKHDIIEKFGGIT